MARPNPPFSDLAVEKSHSVNSTALQALAATVTNSAMATVYETDCARAQTWFLTLTKATPLNMDALRGWALTNQALFGMHVASGTFIIALAKSDTQQNMLNKLRTLIENSGGDRTALAAVKPLDVFHMELWG